MNVEMIKAYIEQMPEVAEWSDLVSVFTRSGKQSHPDWEIPILVYQAMGGTDDLADVGATAVSCMQISIMLVDDILDDDPRGEHLHRGVGSTANLALAFQAAAFRVLDFAPITISQKATIITTLSHLSLATAYGQHLDNQNLSGEANYWRVVRAKSTPFYSAIYQIGGILGQAAPSVLEKLKAFGIIIGEMIQIEDDLHDAFQIPANADWLQGRNNLLILYARTADHPTRERFVELLDEIQDQEKLKKAQHILVESGAVSYSAYHLTERFKEANRLLAELKLANPTPLKAMLEAYAGSLVALLQLGGMEISLETILGN